MLQWQKIFITIVDAYQCFICYLHIKELFICAVLALLTG